MELPETPLLARNSQEPSLVQAWSVPGEAAAAATSTARISELRTMRGESRLMIFSCSGGISTASRSEG